MELIENNVKVICDVAGCGNLAKYTIKLDNVGVAERINICSDCLKALHSEVERVIINGRKKTENGKREKREI